MSRRPAILADRSFLVALVIAVVVALGFGVIVPVLPLFARSFGVGLFAVTVVVSAFAGVRLLSNVYAGSLADRIGVRRAVGFGALIVAASSLLTAFAPTYAALVVFRGVGGFGSALFFTALLALVVRTVAPGERGRAVGLLQGAFLFGITVGPGVGGVLAEPLGLRLPFVVYAVFCGSAGLVALRFLPPVSRGDEPAAPDTVRVDDQVAAAPPRAPRGLAQTWRAGRALCRDPAFVAALVMMAASRWAATGVRFSLVPVFAVEVVGTSRVLLGAALVVAAVTQLLVLWPAGKVADTVGRRTLGAPAYLLFAGISALFAVSTTVPAFLAVMAAYGIGTGLTSITPPAVVADVVPAEQTGVGVGVLNTAGDLGSVLGPLLSGLLAQELGYGWGFGASAVVLAVGGVAALRMRETRPARAASVAPAAR